MPEDTPIKPDEIPVAGGIPLGPRTLFGAAEIGIAQASVSDLRTVREALLEPQPKPDGLGTFGAILSTGLVAFKLLNDGDWHLPRSWYELLVLTVVAMHSLHSIARWRDAKKPKKLTTIALGHVNAMLSQVRGMDQWQQEVQQQIDKAVQDAVNRTANYYLLQQEARKG